jgi:hypothetical protein
MSSSITMKKRKPCAKGTRWIEKAQKCMTADEKRAYLLAAAEEKVANLKKPLVSISYKVTPSDSQVPVEEKTPEVPVEEKVEVEEKPTGILDSITSVFQPAAEDKKEEESPIAEEKKEDESPIAEEKKEDESPIAEEKKEDESPIAEEKKEEDEEKEEADNLLLKENEKKCPKGYYRHPSHSRNCTRKKRGVDIDIPIPLEKKEVEVPLVEPTVPEPSVPEPETTQTSTSTSILPSFLTSILPTTTPPISTPTPEKEKNEVEDETEKNDQETEKKEPDDPERLEQEAYVKSLGIDEDDLLYPILLDPNFQQKIANKSEFNIFRYNGEIKEVKSHSKSECEAPFELSPHQSFVRHFMSLQTPYNSLLLYHGLGSGKSLSAIGVTEDMRKYLKQVGMNNKKILIVASPSVQANFRMQLFDPSKLQEIGKRGSGIWHLETGIGNDLLQEINPMQTSMTKEYIVKKINSLIHDYYDFIGYDSLANYIEDTVGTVVSTDEPLDDGEENVPAITNIPAGGNERFDEKKLKRIFDHRLIVIDEVHNIIAQENNENKRISMMLLKLVKVAENLRLLFLSATPMYNSYKEIIWLANIMNLNDQRSTIKTSQVFKEDGSFVEEKKDKTGIVIRESGKDILKRKLLGYVSYVRGENPYTFPFRIYPSYFADPENQLLSKTYPAKQFNGTAITAPLTRVQVFSNGLGEYQEKGYRKLVQNVLQNTRIKNIVIDFEGKESFGYIVLQPLISALNMVYPNPKLDEKTEVASSAKEVESAKEDTSFLSDIYGKKGLNSVITYLKEESPHPLAHHFEYKPAILQKYGRIFSPSEIGKYSAKIKTITDIISKSTGIVLIYSKYIEGGLIPLALALEEMGFSRYGNANYTESLYKDPPTDPSGNRIGGPHGLNPQTMQPNETAGGYTAKYVMITGQKYYSPNNTADLRLVTDVSNKNGEHIRVVLISEAGSEGLDFKYIRQVHLLDPWYNMNRADQVIGRAVRHKSHCALPIEQRNVEIYMHATYVNAEEETADLYMYRLAEKKAFLIGNVTRVLKETAVDCLLNIDQTNFTEEKMNQTLSLTLSTNKKTVDFKIGDKSFSSFCDYMENCTFSCNNSENNSKNNSKEEEEGDTKTKTKTPEKTRKTDDYTFLQSNHSKISKRIRQLYREKISYSLEELIQEIDLLSGSESSDTGSSSLKGKGYPIETIYYSISVFLRDKEWLVDKKGHKGYMIQRGDMYVFQPMEIRDERASIFERSVPLDYKRASITIEMPTDPILSKEKIKPVYVPTKSARRLTELGLSNRKKKTYDQNQNQEDEDQDKDDQDQDDQEEEDKEDEENSGKVQGILSILQKHIEFILGKSSFVKPGKQDRTWYVYAKMALKVCVEKHVMDRLAIIRYVVFHFLDLMEMEDKRILLENLVPKNLENQEKEEKIQQKKTSERMEDMVQLYFLERIWKGSKKNYILLYNNRTENKIFSLSTGSGSSWKEDTPNKENAEWLEKFNVRVQLLNKLNEDAENITEMYIGFIGFLKEGIQGFKNMNINNNRTRPNPGALCDQTDKKKLIHKINELLAFMGRNEESYTEDPIMFSQPIERPTLCVIYEFLMRFFTEQENQLWYLTPEQAVATKLDTFVVKIQKIFGAKLFVLQ